MSEKIVVDPKIVERLKHWIIMKENQNIKSHANGDSDMVKAIKKRIEEEVNVTIIN